MFFNLTSRKLKFTSFNFNLTPLLVPKCEVYSNLVGVLPSCVYLLRAVCLPSVYYLFIYQNELTVTA